MQRFFDTVLDRQGNPADGVSVYVVDASTGLPVTLYLAYENTENPSSAIGNPFVTDSAGTVAFAVPDGYYTITYTGPNINPKRMPWYVMGSRNAAWGGIGGTMANQTDLQAALDALSTGKQDLNAELTAVENITTTGYVKRTGTATWTTVTTIPWGDLVSVPIFSGSTAGLVPTSVGGTTTYLRADGTWASAGGIRSTVTYTTASLAVGQAETGSFTMPKSAKAFKLVTDQIAWVRVYKSASQQTSDLTRSSYSVAPGPNHGCMLEVETSESLTWDLSPEAPISLPTGTTAYITVVNTGSAATAIGTTISFLSEEG